jgi:hypothetical protein
MKGMKEMIEKEIEKEEKLTNNIVKKEIIINNNHININKEIDNKPILVNNSVSNNSNIINKPIDNNKIKNIKDLKEYLETQKMLMELEKLQNEELEDDHYNYIDNNNNLENNDDENDILKEFEDLNEKDLIGTGVDENEIMNSHNNYFDYNSNFLNNFLDNLNNDYDPIVVNSGINANNNFNNLNLFSNENTIEQNMRTEIENEIGKDLFQKIYKILADNLNTNILTYDIENINKKIKEDSGTCDEIILDMSLMRLPEIYCLIIKDRDRNNIRFN